MEITHAKIGRSMKKRAMQECSGFLLICGRGFGVGVGT